MASHETPGGKRLQMREYRYDGAGQLQAIRDVRRGDLDYRYDPAGRLLSALSAQGEERFAFDPAGNLLDDPHTRRIEADSERGTAEYASRIQGRPVLLDNLLKGYAGTHYRYDEFGNLTQRTQQGEQTEYRWDLFDRLVSSSSPTMRVAYHYDALGRRILKESTAQGLRAPDADGRGAGATLYGWDGDTLAWESGDAYAGGQARTTHYVYEPGGFVPLAQASQSGYIGLHAQPVYEGRYDIDRDPLWISVTEPVAFAQIGYYQCDHLGTPQEITDAQGEVAWSAHYKAWGEAKEAISTAARRAGISNPLRFQGQYHDHETGLHYNRHRYYDPKTGRFISKDPIGLQGGLNVYQYAPNPIGWIDPRGLTSGGKATINWYDNRGPDNAYGHYSVSVEHGGSVLKTHQLGAPGTDTMISNDLTMLDPKTDPLAKSGTVDLPDAKSAQNFQKENLNKIGPAYDTKHRSCVTHVGDVLRAGGVNVPKEPGAQFKFLKRLGL